MIRTMSYRAGYSYPNRDKEYVLLPTSNIEKNVYK